MRMIVVPRTDCTVHKRVLAWILDEHVLVLEFGAKISRNPEATM